MTSKETPIQISGVFKAFSGRKVLEGVDLEVQKGETLVILGRSGCGKSVLLRHVLGLLEPDAGEVRVFGEAIAGMSRKRRAEMRLKFGMVFQNAALFDSLSTAENIEFGLMEHRMLKPREARARARECLEMVGLEGVEERLPSDLSGGMRKRVALARAIAMRPEVILYDEPTTGLDPMTSEQINDLMVKLKNSLGVTAIAVTHDMHSALKVASRIALIDEGKIRCVETPEGARRSADPLLQQFLANL
ncbi:MAG: ABC transporter ATP-binding protein [Candidatus Omnitrophica bacterium]|jgi:phospholipid/cholesterol/gamma-HCH transport system ATP-binding protein|nr:ABC transporter ATP-binding protein [Candidatus Omnitrophota bacterium]